MVAGGSVILLLILVTNRVRGWCLYLCTDDPRDRTLCAVDPNLGPKLFRGRCHMRKTNYCQGVEYEEREMLLCAESDAVARWVASRGAARQFDARRDAWATGPLRRFLLIFNLLTRVIPVPPIPPARFAPDLASMPFPFLFMRPPISGGRRGVI